MAKFDLITRANAEFVEQQYQLYQKDPALVDETWRAFFAGFEMAGGKSPAAAAAGGSGDFSNIAIYDLVHSFRELGHYVANLDPLGHNRPNHQLLELSNFNITAGDLDKNVGRGPFIGPTDGTLRDLMDKLVRTYCGTFGVEFMSIPDKAQRAWLEERMEPVLNAPPLDANQKKWIFQQLCLAQGFEDYCKLKYPTTKRFGLEGGDAFIALLNTIVEDGADLGVEEIVMGMAHRGRLNTLAHVLGKPYEVILSEFEGHPTVDDGEGSGDVKYHLGYSQDRITRSGKKIHLALAFNPSHLELVNPVVEGTVRAKQYRYSDNARNRVVPLLIHGDAAFTGQGIVLETLALSEMPYWRTGGTIHVILNNQIGFTTEPKQGRFTPYPTDVAKTIHAPIFHVNGDDPEACVWAARLAIAFRQQFHCDVFIDLWCYRKHGHNEVDEPSFTQPLMYKQIEKKIPPRDMYQQRLEHEGVLTPESAGEFKSAVKDKLDNALDIARGNRVRNPVAPLGGLWRGITRAPADLSQWGARTAISAERVRQVAEGITTLPADFTVHPKLRKMLDNRLAMGLGKMPIDWGTAEAFALGSLLLEGTAIRFVGQDAQRGTFSHRHACLHDYTNGKKFYPLANIHTDQAPLAIVNTMLSELAVLGFEYGFSIADPRNLLVWEAQFGDFVNGAQPIIDQFIVASESKWQKYSGLVLLLPHGYEGQGPEHSYAYLDRFLALCAENNIQVIQPTLPSQHFHALRRQMLRRFRKPLIALMPKSLLRSEAASSKLEEITQGQFQLVIDDPTVSDLSAITRVLLCTGKVYFTLSKAAADHGIRDTAIVRVEQLYPFPEQEIRDILVRYRKAAEVGWVQEEPQNRGAWSFMDQQMARLLPDRVLKYFGRDPAASPATGNYKQHTLEEKELLAAALNIGAHVPGAPAAVRA
ncbi:MAG: 2-oxoglutarate dehydrogenase E1 component [Tepidisphaeraceae bacterium]|jgi:2-oxoglutarate dehydrogenase E1 component